MKPSIDGTSFGSITVDGETYDHDIVIRLSGKVKKRKKSLSKEETGSSHMVSRGEAEHIYDTGADLVIIGCGQNGALDLSPEALTYFHKHDCIVDMRPTPEAAAAWNSAEGKVVAMFHVTC
ncbi:MAG TPA: MTH938/NDUFAF3 family protein [Candidatus Hydrogenedentes bacterium]|nr:MTH938/NDUFAF3 family protein [Candidatus Hydrogenedentota bacterium]HQM48704.1 MTH938/NDUFAF3 family protein [Candidatus Hydrogenedentota bacterium]